MEILKKLIQLENESATFGFKWENVQQIMAQIRSELTEIEAHLENPVEKNKLQEEIGDLLHAVFSLCVFCKFDASKTLSDSIQKFERRFRETQKLANKNGLIDLNGQSFERLMAFWNQAKELVG
jgi:uncharacterized protein YabN with tetrapyrrole methylase and pyrophosphatase domain